MSAALFAHPISAVLSLQDSTISSWFRCSMIGGRFTRDICAVGLTAAMDSKVSLFLYDRRFLPAIDLLGLRNRHHART